MVNLDPTSLFMAISLVLLFVSLVVWSIRTLRQFFKDIHLAVLEYKKAKIGGITLQEANKILKRVETAFINLSYNLKRLLVPGRVSPWITDLEE